jgi:hypothetical protein
MLVSMLQGAGQNRSENQPILAVASLLHKLTKMQVPDAVAFRLQANVGLSLLSMSTDQSARNYVSYQGSTSKSLKEQGQSEHCRHSVDLQADPPTGTPHRKRGSPGACRCQDARPPSGERGCPQCQEREPPPRSECCTRGSLEISLRSLRGQRVAMNSSFGNQCRPGTLTSLAFAVQNSEKCDVW